MNKPHMDRETQDRGGREYFVSVEVADQVRQKGIIVTHPQWNRIKERVRNIPSSENKWRSAFSTLLVMGVSFLIEALRLEHPNGVASWVTAGFYMASLMSFGGAIACWFSYREIKAHREYCTKILLEDMDDIERLYQS